MKCSTPLNVCSVSSDLLNIDQSRLYELFQPLPQYYQISYNPPAYNTELTR